MKIQIKSLIVASLIAISSCQPAVASEQDREISQVELEFTKVAYGFGFCHYYISKTDWLDNRRRILSHIGQVNASFIDSFYDKGRRDYNRKGLELHDGYVCVRTVNKLVAETNEKLD